MDTNNPAAAALLLLPPPPPCRYGTSKNYDYSNPQYMESSFPFTQIVWRSTFAVGCAAQTCSSGIVGTLVLCRWARLNIAQAEQPKTCCMSYMPGSQP
jgi:hypothetical protein